MTVGKHGKNVLCSILTAAMILTGSGIPQMNVYATEESVENSKTADDSQPVAESADDETQDPDTGDQNPGDEETPVGTPEDTDSDKGDTEFNEEDADSDVEDGDESEEDADGENIPDESEEDTDQSDTPEEGEDDTVTRPAGSTTNMKTAASTKSVSAEDEETKDYISGGDFTGLEWTTDGKCMGGSCRCTS